jgi:hypothetical protein
MKHYYIVKWDERRKDGFIRSCERHFDNEQEQTKFWFDLHHNKEVIWICKTTEVITDRY